MRVSGAKAKNQTFAIARKVQKLEDRLAFKKEIAGIYQTAKYEYSFAQHGGAQGDISLSGPELPLNAVVTRAIAIAELAPTEAGGPTAAITFEIKGADDMINSEAIATFILDTPVDMIQDGTAATMLLLDDAGLDSRKVQMSIESADLTAGIIHVYVEFIVAYK